MSKPSEADVRKDNQGEPVFAFVEFRPCGCVCAAATPEALGDMMKTKRFRESMAAGKVRAVMSRPEWLALPWKCAVCRPEKKKQKRLL